MDNSIKRNEKWKDSKMPSYVYKLCMKYITKELIVYGVTGVATTVVNYISYLACTRVLELAPFYSNIVSWLVAVVFAYASNKLWVFHSKYEGLVDEIEKISKFFGARILTLGIEVAGFYILVDRMGVYDLIAKAFLSIFVILFNYILSKLFIFNNKNL